MKKYALFAAAALVALAACSKNEVKPQTPETPVDDDSPVAVQFGVASPVSSVVNPMVRWMGGMSRNPCIFILLQEKQVLLTILLQHLLLIMLQLRRLQLEQPLSLLQIRLIMESLSIMLIMTFMTFTGIL